MALIPHLLGRASFPARFAWFLEGWWRGLVLSPDELQRRLALAPEQTVLEIGSGGGYYARPLASRVRRLIAVDIQLAMLARLRRLGRAPMPFPVQADAGELPLPSASVDVVIAVTVLGEVGSIEKTLAEVRRVLRPGARFAASEHLPDPDFIAFPRLEALCRSHGLTLRARFGRRFNYTAVFSAPITPST